MEEELERDRRRAWKSSMANGALFCFALFLLSIRAVNEDDMISAAFGFFGTLWFLVEVWRDNRRRRPKINITEDMRTE